MPVFYVLNIVDAEISSLLEAIRYICNPLEKQRAHVTVRGPYNQRIDITQINRKLGMECLEVYGTGNFFESGQNTIFLRCTSPTMRDCWYKPDYPYNPHISLYDGKAGAFARDLFRVADRHDLRFQVRVTGLEPLWSRRGQKDFSLRMAFNDHQISVALGTKFDLCKVHLWSDDVRVKAVDRLLAMLAAHSHGHSTAFVSAKAVLDSKLRSESAIEKLTGMYRALVRAGKSERIHDHSVLIPMLVGERVYRELTEGEREELGSHYVEYLKPLLGAP